MYYFQYLQIKQKKIIFCTILVTCIIFAFFNEAYHHMDLNISAGSASNMVLSHVFKLTEFSNGSPALQLQPNRIKDTEKYNKTWNNASSDSGINMPNIIEGREMEIRKKIRQIFQQSHFPNLPECFKVLNVSFIRELKNPCWFENKNKPPIRCLPYFFIAGTPKSASTDIFLRVAQHPDIHIPPRRTTRKLHWWSTKILRQNTWSEYLDNLSLGPYLQSDNCILGPNFKLFFHYCKHLITGDGSASTLWNSYNIMKQLKNISKSLKGTRWNSFLQQIKALRKKTAFKTDINDDITLADIIYLLLPQSRIILILREPTERVYSAYKAFMVRRHPELSSYDFDSFVNNFMNMWKDCVKNNTDRFCAYNEKSIRREPFLPQVGLYSLFLKDWLAVFPRHQILIVRNEDYKVDMKNILRKIYEHLGLKPLDESGLEDICSIRKINVNTQVNIGDMLPQTRKRLKEFYKPYNIELASILNDSKYLWE